MVIPEEKKSLEARKALLDVKLDQVREKLSQRRTPVKYFIISFLGIFAFILFVTIISGGIKFLYHLQKDLELLGLIIAITTLISLLIALAYPLLTNSIYKSQERILLGELAILSSDKLQDEIEEDFFTNLVKINFKY